MRSTERARKEEERKRRRSCSGSADRGVRRIRGHNVVLDSDLADLYGVETRVLNQAVRRNAVRFPDDFVFVLSDEEFAELKSRSGTFCTGHGGRRTRPHVFTACGALMVATVLRSPRAAAISMLAVRAFVKLRRDASPEDAIRRWCEELEEATRAHDRAVRPIIDVLRRLMKEPPLLKS